MLGNIPLSQVSIWVNVTRIEEDLISNNMVHLMEYFLNHLDLSNISIW